jgi:hypothetical protein
MLVRIRFAKGPQVDKKRRKNQRTALLVGTLLNPMAAMAAVLALWRIAADLNWTSSFAIDSGFFSHWQVWLGAAVILQVCARMLNRYGKSADQSQRSCRMDLSLIF